MANRSERQLHCLLAVMELQVKELQKANVKVCCLHDKFNNKKQLMQGKYSIVYETPEAA